MNRHRTDDGVRELVNDKTFNLATGLTHNPTGVHVHSQVRHCGAATKVHVLDGAEVLHRAEVLRLCVRVKGA